MIKSVQSGNLSFGKTVITNVTNRKDFQPAFSSLKLKSQPAMDTCSFKGDPYWNVEWPVVNGYTIRHDANLEGANFVDAKFHWGVTTMPKKLMGADFTRAYLGCAYLEHADLRKAIFESANLEHIHLSWANLEEVIFRDAIMIGANLVNATCTKANFERANLTGANLTRADLTDVSLINAQLDMVTLDQKALCTISKESKDYIMKNYRLVDNYDQSITLKKLKISSNS